MGSRARLDSIVTHPITRVLAGALLALATVMINDVRGTVAKQSEAMESLKTEVREYKSTATTEDIKLGSRIDVLELKLQLSTAELDKRLAEWDRYWTDFQPALKRWMNKQRD